MKKSNLKRIISAICLLGMLSSLTACTNEPVSTVTTEISEENTATDTEENSAENNGGEPNWTNPKHDGASDFFVFYPGRSVFELVVYL